MELRPYQIPIFTDNTTGIFGLRWPRQLGKSTVLAAWSARAYETPFTWHAFTPRAHSVNRHRLIAWPNEGAAERSSRQPNRLPVPGRPRRHALKSPIGISNVSRTALSNFKMMSVEALPTTSSPRSTLHAPPKDFLPRLRRDSLSP
jgi:hypothetical protein